MDRRSLRTFVVDAHRNGYASGGGEPADDGGTCVEYRDGDWRYVDRYYGSRSFVGSEVVFHEGTAVWGMHYSGAPTDPDVDSDGIYAFLRDALERVSVETPYRGPERYAGGDFVYRTTVDGSLSRFSGTETIDRDSTPVYRGTFGGDVVE